MPHVVLSRILPRVVLSLLLALLTWSCADSTISTGDDGDQDGDFDFDNPFNPNPDGDSDGDFSDDPKPSTADIAVPEDLYFGSVVINATATKELEIANVGFETLEIASMRLSDATTPEFELLNPPQGRIYLKPNQSYLQSISYTPEDEGADIGTLTIFSNDPEQPVVDVRLVSDYKGSIQLRVEPASLDFGILKVGGERVWKDVTITNRTFGSNDNRLLVLENLHIQDAADSPYRLEANLPDRILIAPNERYVLKVGFEPREEGEFENAVLIAHNDPETGDGPFSLPLVAEAALPHIALNPVPENNEIVFGTVQNGGSQTEMLSIQNVGNWPLTISHLGFESPVNPDFSLTDGVETAIDPDNFEPVVLDPNQSMSLGIHYSPDDYEADVSALLIQSDADGLNPHTLRVALSGHGTANGALADPSVLDFGAVRVDTTSARKAVTIYNRGQETLTIQSIAIVGVDSPFVLADGTEASVTGLDLAVGASVEIGLYYAPPIEQADSDKLRLEIQGGEVPVVEVSLVGSGVRPHLAVEVLESAVEFDGTVRFGQVGMGDSLSRTLRLSNSGGWNLEVNSMDMRPGGSAAISLPDISPVTLQPGESADITVTFEPDAPARAHLAALEIETNEDDVSLPQVINFEGIGADIQAVIDPQDNPFDIGPAIPSSTKTQAFVIEPFGYGDLIITDVRLAPASRGVINGFDLAFNAQQQFPLLIPNGSGEKLAFLLSFTPPEEGSYSAQLIVESNDYLNPVQIVTLSGTGKYSDAEPFISPESPVDVGTAYPQATITKTFTIWNQGTVGDLHVVGMSTSGTDAAAFLPLIVGAPLPVRLSPEDSIGYNWIIAFTPPATGDFSATMTVVTFAGGETQETPIELVGHGRECPEGCWNNDDNPADCEYCGCYLSNAGVEICDGIDNDCDSITDNADSTDLLSVCTPPNNAVAACVDGACDYACGDGYHNCADACVSNSDVATCGSACTPCVAPDNAEAICRDIGLGFECAFQCNDGFVRHGDRCVQTSDVNCCGQECLDCNVVVTPPENASAACIDDACGYLCDSGFHDCEGACVSDVAVESCGERCEPCVAPDNAAPICSGGLCDFICDNGFHREGAECVENSDIDCCGPDCEICTEAPDFGYPFCNVDHCDFICLGGYHQCGELCLGNDSPDSCGLRCEPCPGDANGQAACVDGACALACNEDYHLEEGQCVANSGVDCCGPDCTVCLAPEFAVPVCVNDVCDFICDDDYHRDGDLCLPDGEDPDCCGPDCLQCTDAPDNGTPICQDDACTYVCNFTYHDCGGVCVSDYDVATCGDNCTACPDGENAHATCDGASCNLSCNLGYHVVDGRCVNNSDPSCCGDDCIDCVEVFPQHSNAYCLEGGHCSYTCNQGFHKCDGICVSNYSTESCGHDCSPCPVPPNAQALCVSGHCASVCLSGFHEAPNGDCVSNTTPDCCGLDCVRCAPVQNGEAICEQGQCSAACGEGYHEDGGACVAD